MAQVRVLLLEDNEADAELAVAALSRAGMSVVHQRVEAEGAFSSALADFAPDLVISDHSLARFSSVDAIAAVRNLRPVAPVIVLTGGMRERDVVACLRAGAEDVLLKDNLDELPRAVTTALSLRKELSRLSPRQLEVLRLIALGNTNREIAKKLRVSVKTIETHRMAIMKRLGQHDVTGIVRIAIRFGLVPQQL